MEKFFAPRIFGHTVDGFNRRQRSDECRRYGLATVRYPVLEIIAKVEPFDNGRGFSLSVLRAGKPRIDAAFPERHIQQ